MLKLVRWNLWGLGFPVLALWLGPARLCDWTEILVAEDRNVFMPGAQPGSASLESVNRCDNCHGGYNPSIEPAPHWRGSMMAHAHALQQLKMAASLAPVAETADTITPHISPTPSLTLCNPIRISPRSGIGGRPSTISGCTTTDAHRS